MEIGFDSFGSAVLDPATGDAIGAEQSMRDLLARIAYADRMGIDVFGMGEHHRPDYFDSSPVTILAAAAARTARIKLTSAVTVLSAADPVRVFQAFATLDLISGGGRK